MTESGDDDDESKGAAHASSHASSTAPLFLVRDARKVVEWALLPTLLASLLFSLLASTLVAFGSSAFGSLKVRAVHATNVSQAARARSTKAITCSATSHADSKPPASGFRAEAPERT